MKYEIWKSNGLWYWHLKAGNSQIIAAGEGYYNRQDCLHVISLVSTSSACQVYDLTTS